MPVRESLSGVGVVIDLSNRDYYGYRNDALGLIPILTPEWTDLHPTDPGIVTVEVVCAVGDNLSLYSDRNANENYLATCNERASGLKFARFSTYPVRQNTSAIVLEDVTVSGPGSVAVGFPVGTKNLQAQGVVRYELRNALTVTVGPYPKVISDVEFIEGESYDEVLGSSTGLADQIFRLSRAPIAHNPNGTSSLVIEVNDGGWLVWTLVTDFTESGPLDTHYRVFVDESDNVDVQFGDGVNGKIPATGTSNVRSTARVGGGERGNKVGTDLVTEILAASPGIVDSVTNTDVPQGGQEKESLAELKINIPRHNRANDRAVTAPDYAYWAERVGGVAAAKAVRGPSAYRMNVRVRAAGMNPYPAGSWNERLETGVGLVGQVGSLLNEKREGPVRLGIGGPDLVRTFMDVDVHVLDTYVQTTVQTAVDRALSAAFNGFEIDSEGVSLGDEIDIPSTAALPGGFPRNMGDHLKLSYLHHLLESIPGVDYVDITRLQRDPYALKLYDFGTDATFSQIEVGQNTDRQTWTLRFISPTTFSVLGSVSGLQVATGTVGVPYTTDGLQITFTITAGLISHFTGNRYEIVTGPYLDTIEIGDYELLTNYQTPGYATWGVALFGGIIL